MNTNNKIEDIRRRAKDNKAENTKFYLSKTLETGNSIKLLFITLATTALALKDKLNFTNNCINEFLFISIILGVFSYYLDYFYYLKKANFYSKVEEIYASQTYPTEERYNQMYEAEKKLKSEQSEMLYRVSNFLTAFQAIFVVLIIWKILVK